MDSANNYVHAADDQCRKCSAQTDCPKWSATDRSGRSGLETQGLVRTLKRGEHLYNAGAAVEFVDIVRSGTLKTFVISADGNEEVLGFHSPGDLVGLEGLSASVHHTYAAAV